MPQAAATDRKLSATEISGRTMLPKATSSTPTASSVTASSTIGVR